MKVFLRMFVSQLVLLIFINTTQANDLFFGANTIPYMVENSDAVIVAKISKSPTKADSRMLFYEADVVFTLRGDVTKDRLILRNYEKTIEGTYLIFLTKAEPKNKYNYNYSFTAGNYSCFSTRNPKYEIVLEYLACSKENHISWAKKYFAHENDQIAKSAITALDIDEKAIQLLDHIVTNSIVDTSIKDFAVTHLANSNNETAKKILQKIADDDNLNPVLRSHAKSYLKE